MKINIIAIAGQKHVGKSTLAKKILKTLKHPAIIDNFAHPLKNLLNMYHYPKWIDKEQDKEFYRKDMQVLGDAVRDYDKNFFATILINSMRSHINLITPFGSESKGDLTIIIDDLRYVNELENLYEYCQELSNEKFEVNFKVVLLQNPWTDYNTDSHSSETEFLKLEKICQNMVYGKNDFPINCFVHNRAKGDTDSEELIEMILGVPMVLKDE